jgi:hypothetical protein
MTLIVKCDGEGCKAQLDPECTSPRFDLTDGPHDAPIEIALRFTGRWEQTQHYCDDCAKKLILRLAESLRA